LLDTQPTLAQMIHAHFVVSIAARAQQTKVEVLGSCLTRLMTYPARSQARLSAIIKQLKS
jgi:hypothetical protein